MEYFENNFTALPNSDKIVICNMDWTFLRNRRLILRLHRPTVFRALTYWAHRAVILAIAWFSCHRLLLATSSETLDIQDYIGPTGHSSSMAFQWSPNAWPWMNLN